MFTALDLLIVVVMVLAAASLLGLVLMFLVKNQKVKRVCFYAVAALGLYMGYVGFRIHYPGFLPQMVLAAVVALTALGAVALERLGKGDGKRFRLAQILASVSLIVGMLNAFS